MGFLTKEAIAAAKDLKREAVDVPEWGDGAQVLIGEVSAQDRIKFGQSMESEENASKPYHALALTWFIFGEDNARMFSEADADLLAEKSPEVLRRLYGVAARLNAFGGSIEEAAKN